MDRRRELGRGERVLDGLWRLRLPLPWPGIPHCNAWAVARGDGIVLFDCGMHEPGSLGQLQRALEQVGRSLEQVRLLACTHAHSDHWGQAAPVCERAGCELWMHPDHAHGVSDAQGEERRLERRLEIARQCGVSERALREYSLRQRERPSGVARAIAPHRPLRDGIQIESDLGPWQVYETPGHSPSHVCFFEPRRRILISGDHVLGRVSPYYDYGYSPDPVGEFLRSLDLVERLGARLALSGHGRPFTDVRGHIEANRRLVARRLAAVREQLARGPRTGLELAQAIFEEPLTDFTAPWRLTETLCYLRHLEIAGEASVHKDGELARWRAG